MKVISKLKILFDEIKATDPKSPWLWPAPAKIIVYVTIIGMTVIAGAAVDWSMQVEELGAAEQKEKTLRAEYLGKKQQANSIVNVKKKMDETQQSFGALLKQLPNKAEMETMLTDINHAGVNRGLQFELFRPGVEATNGIFAELPIAIRLSGNYDNLGRFVDDVAHLSRLVTLNNVQINSEKAGRVSLSATAKTYRYLSEEEIAENKKKEAEKKKAKKEAKE